MEIASDDSTLPFALGVARGDFSEDTAFDPDTYLSEKHRFTALDTLGSDLSALSGSLNAELLDLVNAEHASFVKLGQLISGCVDLLDHVRESVAGFSSNVSTTRDHLVDLRRVADVALAHKQKLTLVKNKARLLLLLNEQCSSFETELGLEPESHDCAALTQKLSSLLVLYLSVTQIAGVVGSENTELDPTTLDASLSSSTDHMLVFQRQLAAKVAVLQKEFVAYVREFLVRSMAETTKYGSLIVMILRFYEVTGRTAEALEVLNRRETSNGHK